MPEVISGWNPPGMLLIVAIVLALAFLVTMTTRALMRRFHERQTAVSRTPGEPPPQSQE